MGSSLVSPDDRSRSSSDRVGRIPERLDPASWFPAAVAGITARRLTLPSGMSVRLLETGPLSGPPVLLLHGWAVSSYLWRHTLPALGVAGFRAISIDLPGHGLSDAPSGAGSYSLPSFTNRVRELLDTLGVARVSIVAQSMGGKIAVRFALDSPERVARLVLFGPVGFGILPPWQVLSPLVPPLPGAVPSILVPRRAVEFVQRRVYGKLGWFSERDIDEYWAPTQFPDVVRAALQMLKEFDWAPWAPTVLADLRTPTEVIFGTRDRTVRPVRAERLAAALPDGRLTWITDGGHVLMEEVPERANAILLSALSGARLDSTP